MAWVKAGSTTLDGTNDVIDVTSLSNNKFITLLNHGLYSGDANGTFNFNNDTGSNYAQRQSYAGGSDGTPETSQTKFSYNDSSTHDSIFAVSDIVNIAGEEKLFITHYGTVTSTGANAPFRAEQVGKWANTSDAITSIKHTQSSSGGDYLSGSNVSVLGSDGVESLNVQDGAVYYETDTNKEYVLYDNTWSEV